MWTPEHLKTGHHKDLFRRGSRIVWLRSGREEALCRVRAIHSPRFNVRSSNCDVKS